MRIAYLLNSVSRKSGGLFEICRQLAQRSCQQHEIIVLGVADEYTDADIKLWAPLRPKIFAAMGPRSFGYAPGYVKELARAAPDLGHVHGLWTYHSLAGYMWHRRAKQPLVYTTHGMLDPWALRNSAWKKRLVRVLWENAAHRSAACFHVNSEAEHLALRRYGLGNPICVIQNGVELPDLAESSESRVGGSLFGFTKGRKILFYLGRLHPKKNLANLVRAWKHNLDSQPSTLNSWALAIAGWDQGGYEHELKRLATDLGLSFAEIRNQKSEIRSGEMSSGLSKDVAAGTAAATAQLSASLFFLGPLFGEQKAAAYRSCDAFILPSFSEGLPMTVLEAWAYTKPVLMTTECNLPEGVAAGAALQIGTETTDIARGLTQLFGMAETERKEMGFRGQALVAERFSWPRIGKQMRAVYEWVLGGGRPPETVRLK